MARAPAANLGPTDERILFLSPSSAPDSFPMIPLHFQKTTTPRWPQARFPVVWLVIAGCLLHGEVTSEEWQALDRDAAVRQALSGNLELRAATWEVRKARARLRWAGKLDPPEIELSASTDQFGLDDDESLLEIGIAQRFPVTDRLKREKDLSRVEVAMAEAEIAEARRRLIAEVERSFVDTRAAQEEVELLGEIRDLLRGFVETLERQAAQGTVSTLDVNQAKLDRQQIEKELQRQRTEVERRLSGLKTLLGVTDDTRLRLQGLMGLPDDQPETPALESSRNRRPDFQLSVLREDRARAELALAEAGRWEDVAVRLFAEREASVDEPEGLERNRFVGVGVSIPLPLKKERVTDEPAAKLGQAEDQSRALALKIENEIAGAAKVRDELLALARDTAGETLSLAEKNLDAISKAYANGQIELVKYQRAQEQLLEARRSALNSRAAYQRAEVDLREAAALSPEIEFSGESNK